MRLQGRARGDNWRGEVSARVVPVILSDDLRRGDGTEENPVRVVIQAFTLDGELVAEFDPAGHGQFPHLSPSSHARGLGLLGGVPPTWQASGVRWSGEGS